ncbi:MAG: sulfatase [Actinobacteria bacterium]|nr:sulfatase [Actinomycetota bacterium]MCL5444841.1 sulfatase [Actinomycetota bacterium]
MRILYCDVDTLRADHTGPYGYQRRVTPNLDELAVDSVVFDSCYCSDSPCSPSRAALTSGQFGITTGAIANFGPAGDIRMFERTRHAPFFGGYLYRNGIYTASISCFPERHMSYWFLGNFREWMKPSLSNGDDEDAGVVTSKAVDWLRRHGRDEDWFLQVHFWDPHIPYMEPKKWFDLAAQSGDPPAWPDGDTIASHREFYGPHSALDLYEGDGSWSVPPASSPNSTTMPDAIEGRDDFIKMANGYDGAVLYWDHHLGQLMETLEELGIRDETAVVVASDHGESLGENGCYGDHPMANEATHHVPMIVRWPGVTDSLEPNQRHVDGLVYHIDLCPTICDLLGLAIPPGWDGESFAAGVRGQEFKGRDHLILSHGSYTYQRAVRTREHLYVRTLHPGCWRLDQEQLYAIDRDRHMTNNLADDEPLRTELSGLLDTWRSEHCTLSGELPDPMEAGRYEGPSDAFSVERYLLRLEQTGRSHLADDLRSRLSKEWVTSRRW